MKSRGILVVENSEGISRTVRELFSFWDVKLLHVDTLSSAYAHVRRSQYNAVVLDADVCENRESDMVPAIRKFPSNTNVITAIDCSADEKRLKELQVLGVGILRKPISAQALFRMLTGSLDRRAVDRERDKLLGEMARASDTIKAQSAAIDRMAKLITSVLGELPTTAPRPVWNNGANAENIFAKPDFYRATSLLAALLDELRKDKATKKYESQLAMLATYLEDLGLGATCKNSHLRDLSLRELRIVSMIKCGMTTDQIAEQLHISPDTVKTHRRNIRKKLDIVGAKDDLASFLRFDANDHAGQSAG